MFARARTCASCAQRLPACTAAPPAILRRLAASVVPLTQLIQHFIVQFSRQFTGPVQHLGPNSSAPTFDQRAVAGRAGRPPLLLKPVAYHLALVAAGPAKRGSPGRQAAQLGSCKGTAGRHNRAMPLGHPLRLHLLGHGTRTASHKVLVLLHWSGSHPAAGTNGPSPPYTLSRPFPPPLPTGASAPAAPLAPSSPASSWPPAAPRWPAQCPSPSAGRNCRGGLGRRTGAPGCRCRRRPTAAACGGELGQLSAPVAALHRTAADDPNAGLPASAVRARVRRVLTFRCPPAAAPSPPACAGSPRGAAGAPARTPSAPRRPPWLNPSCSAAAPGAAGGERRLAECRDAAGHRIAADGPMNRPAVGGAACALPAVRCLVSSFSLHTSAAYTSSSSCIEPSMNMHKCSTARVRLSQSQRRHRTGAAAAAATAAAPSTTRAPRPPTVGALSLPQEPKAAVATTNRL